MRRLAILFALVALFVHVPYCELVKAWRNMRIRKRLHDGVLLWLIFWRK